MVYYYLFNYADFSSVLFISLRFALLNIITEGAVMAVEHFLHNLIHANDKYKVLHLGWGTPPVSVQAHG